MTGFGSASVEEEDLSAVVEVRSVNNRYLKIMPKVPAALNGRGPEIESAVRRRVRRGTVTVAIRVRLGARAPAYALNAAALIAHRTALAEVAEREGIPGELSVRDLALLPGVFEPVDIEAAMPDADWTRIRAAIGTALDALIAMRETEGAALRSEFVERKTLIETHLETVRTRTPLVVEDYRTRLVDRLDAVLADRGVAVSPEDILKEATIFADRADITEEVARMASHLAQYDTIISCGGEMGRRLEFILQEMLREANTIGAKANDYEISDAIVSIKTEIEKLKEQVQNLE